MPALHSRSPSVRLRLSAFVLALGLGATAGSQAQGLQELYDAARGFDATYLAARALAESAQYKAAQADALRLPSVSVNGSLTRNNVVLPVGPTVNNTAAQAVLQGRQALYNPANTATIEQARRSLELAASDLESAEQDLIVRLAQAYFDVLTAQNALATAQTGKAAIAEQLASAKRNFEVGTATITDTREAQARFDLARAQEIAADNDLRSKRIALDQLVGRKDIAPNELATPVLLPPLAPADPEGWVQVAEGQHPAIRKARLAQDIAGFETAKARAGNLPTLDLVGSYSDTHNSGLTVTVSGAKSGTTRSAALGLQMNLPLFAGYSIQNRIKETVLLEDKARNDLEATRRGVAQATRVAYFGVQSLQAQVQALEAAESSSKLALEATQLGYKVGVRVNIDVLNAQTQLFTTRRDLAKARYDVIVNGLRLRQASGQLQPQDVKAVDALLAR